MQEKKSVAPLNVSKAQRKQQEEQIEKIGNSASKTQTKSYLEALTGKKQKNSIANSNISVGQISEKASMALSDKDNVVSRIKNGTDSPLPIPVAELVIIDADSVPSKVSSINADNDSVNNVDTIVPSVASDAKNQARPALKRRSSDESWVSSISAGSAGYEKVEKDDLSQTSKSQSDGYYR